MNVKFPQIRGEALKLTRHTGLHAVLTPFAMALWFMLSNPALADGKEYPGTMCEESNTDTNGMPRKPEGNIVFTTEGEALNLSTATLITCPLVRDAERRQGQILYAAVSVYQPSKYGVACALVSRPYFGGWGRLQSKTTSPGNAGLYLIEFPAQADNFTSGTYNLFCLVPQAVAGEKSGIAHYGIVEAD